MIRFHREGYTIIFITFSIVIAGVLLADNYIDHLMVSKAIQIALFIFLILILQFFRNPKRSTPINDDAIIAPVDAPDTTPPPISNPDASP